MLRKLRFYRNKNVIVAGGAGFIGSAIARMLLDCGAKVTVIDSLARNCGGNLFNLEEIKNRIKFIRADIVRSRITARIIKKADVIFNCIGMTSHLKSNAEPLKDMEYNALNHLLLLELCRKHNPAARIVYLGSRGQYGAAGQNPVRESNAMYPLDFHSAHKTLGEFYHALYRRNFGIWTVTLRMTNVYGPRQDMRGNNPGILNYFVKTALSGGEIVIFGSEKRSKDFIFVEDAANAALLVGTSKEAGGKAFNIGGSRVVLADAARQTILLTGRGKLCLKPFPEKLRKIDTGDILLDSSSARETFGWKPATRLYEGLKATVDFYASKGK
jgi:nucleoside-diphosphate-sugar epimerase